MQEQELATQHHLLNEQMWNDKLANEFNMKLHFELKSKFPDTLGWFKNDLNMLNNKEMFNEDMMRKLNTEIELSQKQQELLNEKLFSLKGQQFELQNYANEELFKNKELLEQYHLSQQQDKMSVMIDELYESGVIKDKNNIRLKLTNTELLVNGKKQSAELHKRILKMMQKEPGDKVNFEYNLTH